MKLFILATLCGVLFSIACKSKKSDASVTINTPDNDFTEQFATLALPINLADTSLDRILTKEKALKIVGKNYFPDSLIQSYFEKGEKISYYSIGKAQNEDQEVYIVMKAIGATKKGVFLLCYDNTLKYKDGRLICKTDADSKTSYRAVITKNFDIKIIKSELVENSDAILTETSLAYNNAGFLGTVVTNDSDDEMDLQNPIDTLKQTRKYTGDYYADKKNFVSLRDGKDSGELIFFYHFEKNKDDCSGEIKDRILMTGPNTAIFMHDGDPCVMNIQFTASQLILKEDHGCGNKRPLDCTIDGNFTRKTGKNKVDKKVAPLPAATTDPSSVNTTPKKPKTTVPLKKPVTKPVKPTDIKPNPPKKAPVKQTEIQ
jgi:hypothetical protein